MHDHESLKAELALIERQISDACQRAAQREDTIGLIRSLHRDPGAADRALMATYQALGVLTRRRATLLKVLG